MLHSAGCQPDRVRDRPRRGIAVGDDRDSAQAEQVGAAVGVRIEPLAQVARSRADEETADLAARRSIDLVAQRVEQRLDGALHQLEGDVAREAVGDDNLAGAFEERPALDVAPEVEAASLEELMGLEDELAPLLRL